MPRWPDVSDIVQFTDQPNENIASLAFEGEAIVLSIYNRKSLAFCTLLLTTHTSVRSCWDLPLFAVKVVRKGTLSDLAASPDELLTHEKKSVRCAAMKLMRREELKAQSLCLSKSNASSC